MHVPVPTDHLQQRSLHSDSVAVSEHKYSSPVLIYRVSPWLLFTMLSSLAISLRFPSSSRQCGVLRLTLWCIRLHMWKERAPNHRFVVYAVPTPRTGMDQLLCICRQWNASPRSLCKELGPWVEFVATDWVREDASILHSLQALWRGCRSC